MLTEHLSEFLLSSQSHILTNGVSTVSIVAKNGRKNDRKNKGRKRQYEKSAIRKEKRRRKAVIELKSNSSLKAKTWKKRIQKGGENINTNVEEFDETETVKMKTNATGKSD